MLIGAVKVIHAIFTKFVLELTSAFSYMINLLFANHNNYNEVKIT